MFNRVLKNFRKKEKLEERYIIQTRIRTILQEIGVSQEVTQSLTGMMKGFQEEYKKIELAFLRRQLEYLESIRR